MQMDQFYQINIIFKMIKNLFTNHKDQDQHQCPPHLADQYYQGAQTDVGGGGVMGGPRLGLL